MNMTPFLIVLGLALVFEGCQGEHEVFVAEGSVAVLPCVDLSSSPSFPTAVYWSKIVGGTMKTVWRRGKNGLEFRPVKDPSRANCPVPNFGKADYSLHIVRVTIEDGGEYVCEVEGKTKMVKTFTLLVVRASFSPHIVVEGSRAAATCRINPERPFVGMNWKRNGKIISNPILSKVSQKDAGDWICQVSKNNVEVEASASLQVRGISSPQDDSTVLYAAIGSSISLPCVFTDGLIPGTVVWNTNASTTKYSASRLSKSSNWSTPTPTIERVEDSDKGMYTCSGVMEGLNGKKFKVKRTMELVVARVLSSSSSSGYGPLTLTCHTSNSSQITSYEWLRVTYGPNDTQTVTSVKNTRTLMIQQVTEKDAGEWMCRFSGNQGILGNVTYHLHMTGAMKSEKSISGNKTAMVMGLGLCFLVIFLILFQMYRNYRRKRMILLYPAMETIVHQTATERERRRRSQEKMIEACVGEPKTVCV